MIAMLTGRVAHIGLDSLVLDVGGVGYRVRTTPEALASTRHGAELTLHTELVVREDSMTLYGFPHEEDADVFRQIQTVSGVGPRIALAVLAVLAPADLRRAVATEDAKAITRTPGVGPKVAQRMILELKDRLAPAAAPASGPAAPGAVGADGPPTATAARADVTRALIGLGWPEKAAADAVEKTAAAAEEEPGALLRAALRELGGSR